MKLKMRLLFTAALIFCFIQNTSAKIWRVNNLSDYVAGSLTQYGANVGGTYTKPVFNQLTNSLGTTGAIGSNLVENGDTIHLEGASLPYSGGLLKKRLIIIGAGYFLSENPRTSSNNFDCTISSPVSFDATSAGTQLIGINFIGNASPIRNNENNVSDIVIKRCKIVDGTIKVGDGSCSNIIITQNYFVNTSGTSSFSQAAIQPGSATTGCPANLVFNNNICERLLGTVSNDATINFHQCNNNIFNCPPLSGSTSLKFTAVECRNNIVKSSGLLIETNGNNNPGFSHNTSNSTSQLLGNGVTNVFATNINYMFINTGSTDGKYMLNPSSVDNLLGSDNTERGAFGGIATTNHYTLSGLAPIPVVYQITTSGVADSTGLPVTIKARTIQ